MNKKLQMKTMKTNKFFLLAVFILSAFVNHGAFAQKDSTINEALNDAERDNKPPGRSVTKFLLTGNAMAFYQTSNWNQNMANNFASASGVSGLSNTYFPGRLMLMPLAKLTDNIFFQGQIEVDPAAGKQGGSAINTAELLFYYKINPYMTAFFGYFNPRFGLYNGILDDFTNRYGTAAVGMNHASGGLTGVGIQGGIQTGTSKINYQIYVANGPALDTAAATKGLMLYAFDNNNSTSAYGGNIGWLPFSNSCLEVDLSTLYKPQTEDAAPNSVGGNIYHNVSTESYAANLNYYHVFYPVIVRLQGEYNSTTISANNGSIAGHPEMGLNYNPAANGGTGGYYSNTQTGWYAGATIRYTGTQNKLVRQLELGARIGAYNPPVNAVWGGNQVNQFTLCLTYWNTYKAPYNLAWDHFTTNGVNNLNVLTFRTIYVF